MSFSNPEVAQHVLAVMIEIYQKLNNSLIVVQQKCPTEEFVTYRKAVAAILGGEIFDIVRAICQEHPSLKPPSLFD